MPRIKFGIFILLVVIISGCGGGSGDGETPPPVEPPPVEPPPVEPPPVEPPPFTDNSARWNDLLNEPRFWWRESEPYSCEQTENPDSPWLSAGLIDLGGSDSLSLIRYFGNGSYLRYGFQSLDGCTQPEEHPRGFHLDPPADPTYYSLGDLDIYVDIARVPPSASGWFQDDGRRVNSSMGDAVSLLNQYVASYWRRVSEDNLRITFHAGIEFTVGGDGSPDATHDQQLAELGICVDVNDCERYGFPGGLNRIILNDVSADTAGLGANGWASFGLVSLRNADMELVVHEMGHAWMDWPHSFTEIPWVSSGGAVNYPNSYSNFYDVMSQLDLVRTRGWNVNMPSTMAINRYSAGWIRPEDVALHLQDTGTYRLSKPRESGYQFLVIHSGRRHAFTTLEVLDNYPSGYRVTRVEVYDPSAPGGKRSRRYEGVLVSRYDQSAGTGAQTRVGPALYNRRNPDRLMDVGLGRDDYSVIQDGETREIGGGVSVSAKRNSDGSYEVTVSGGNVAEFQRWCFPIWFPVEEGEDEYDTGCLLNEPLSDF